jgi:PAS domain-containing protein
MSEKPIEVILTRLLASHLAMPVLVVNTDGTLLFFNEPAEAFLGIRYDEAGELPASAWTSVFSPTESPCAALNAAELPPMVAIADSRPAHRTLWVRGQEGHRRLVDVMAFPLIGRQRRQLGAVALLWERPT